MTSELAAAAAEIEGKAMTITDEKLREAWEEMQSALLYKTGGEGVIEAALAELEQLRKQSQWQPIETAPRDGSTIMLHFMPNEVDMPSKSRVASGCWKTFEWRNGHGEKTGEFQAWQSHENLGPMSFAPTHWMPLPTPTKED